MTIQIKMPIWNGSLKKRCIGLAEYKLAGLKDIDIEITHKTKSGRRLDPNLYTIPVEKVMKYPTQTVSGGVVLRLVPLADLTVKGKAVEAVETA